MKPIVDITFEQQVLCCILWDSKLIYQVVAKLSDEDFTDSRNISIFRALKKLLIDEKHDSVDIVLLRSVLSFDNSGLYLTEVYNSSPTTQLINTYIDKIKENSARRALYSLFLASTKEVEKLKVIDFKEWLNDKESQFSEILNNYRKDVVKDTFSPKNYTKRMRFLYKQYRENPSNARGPKTGYRMLDEAMGGLRLLNILAGTTGVGKSVLTFNIASNIAIGQGIPTLYINFEMEADDLHRRMISNLTGIPSNLIFSGHLNDKQWSNIDTQIDRIEKSGLFITDNASKDVNDTIALIHFYRQRYGIQVVFVDYIGEVELDKLAVKEREDITLGRYVQSIKNACSSLGVHCFLVAQLNRKGEDKPSRDNIGGSWKMIQKCDVFMCLWKDKDRNYQLSLLKQRHGEYPLHIPLDFEKDIHKFTEKSQVPF